MPCTKDTAHAPHGFLWHTVPVAVCISVNGLVIEACNFQPLPRVIESRLQHTSLPSRPADAKHMIMTTSLVRCSSLVQ